MKNFIKKFTSLFLIVTVFGGILLFHSCNSDDFKGNEKTSSISIQEAFKTLESVSNDPISFSEVDESLLEEKSSRTDEYYDYFIINQLEADWFQANSNRLNDFWGRHVDVKIKHGGYDFNAYSYPSDSYIYFGEAFYRHFRYNIGGDGVAVTGMLAHEYGHQVQWNLGIGNPKDTLYNELQADALAGYYMGHENGGNLNWDKVKFVAEGQGSVVGEDYGTYDERYNAVRMGYNIAKKNSNISTQDFKKQFDKWFY